MARWSWRRGSWGGASKEEPNIYLEWLSAALNSYGDIEVLRPLAVSIALGATDLRGNADRR